MTKEDIENLIKRYPYIISAVKANLSKTVFYIGNRKQVIEITDDTKSVCKFVQLIYSEEKTEWIRTMIRGIMSGKSDIKIMDEIHFTKNGYYPKKQAFIDKVYYCCISQGLVTFEEILNERIA